MKTKNLVSTIFILALFLAALPLLAQNQKDIEKKLQEMNKEFSQNMLEGKFTHDHYTTDAISMPNNSPMLEGFEAIKASNEQMEQMGVKFEKVEFMVKKVLLNGNLATEIGTYAMTLTFPNMPTPITDKGKYITIWEIQKDGSLKVKVETWNTDMPPAGMN